MFEVKIKIGEKIGKGEFWIKYNRIEKEVEGSYKIKVFVNRFEL